MFGFPDIEIFYWTVMGRWMVCVCDPYQSTSDTKVSGKCLLDNSRTAHFIKCGNYFPDRINSKNQIVVLRASEQYPGWKRLVKNDSNLIINENLRPIPINFTNLPV
jgi:hypothetical protein